MAKIYYIDIDDTICNVEGTDYMNAKPIVGRIDTVNDLYDAGNTIVYWTSRGNIADYRKLTKMQLDYWGCKYHRLVTKKPFYDVLIDGKAHSAISLDRFQG